MQPPWARGAVRCDDDDLFILRAKRHLPSHTVFLHLSHHRIYRYGSLGPVQTVYDRRFPSRPGRSVGHAVSSLAWLLDNVVDISRILGK